jgi:release factor glutamine methyltransferase
VYLKKLLKESIQALLNASIENPDRQAHIVLSDALNCSLSDLYLQRERCLSEEEMALCKKRILQRSLGVPPAYLRGDVEFMDCKILVDQRVLIPRPETELLAEKIIKRLTLIDSLKGKRFLDLCTGSGCLGIAIKKKFPDLTVILSDLSKDALELAKINAIENDVLIEVVCGDALAPFIGKEKFDFIVSNPPYLSESEYKFVDKELFCEPKMALVSGDSGFEFYRHIEKFYKTVLNREGILWLEIGFLQGEGVKQLFSGQGEVKKDLSGKDRFFFLEIV